jgi:hypothetical protein
MYADYTEKQPAVYLNKFLFTGREIDILDNSSLKIQNNRNRCYDGCDKLFPPGKCPEEDPLDRNESCKALCDAAYSTATAAAYVEYEATLGVIWGQYGACCTSCHVFWKY